MSITKSLEDVGGYLGAIANPNYPDSGGQYATVLLRPKERLNLEDFPAFVLSMDWQSEHQVQYHADTRSHHRYILAIYLFVGGRNTDLDELHERLEAWPVLVARALFPHITLGGDVEFLGNGEDEAFLPYRVGFFPWGGVASGQPEVYFGAKFTLIVNEEGIETYSA